jgi:hypothetical protein
MRQRRALVLAMTLLAGRADLSLAQDGAAPAAAPAAPDQQVEVSASNLTRVETWRYFDPLTAQVDPDYTFWGNRSDLALRVRGPRFDLAGGFAYVRAEQLPQAAIGPGGLGTGAFYFAASGVPYSYQVFLTSLAVSWHDARRRLAVSAGRMAHTSGAEGEALDPAGTTPQDPAVPGSQAGRAEVRRLAIDGRLVGTFEWSLYQRRFDGIRADWRGSERYAGAGAFVVTQGGYEESANLEMNRLFVATAFAGRRHGDAAESQAFGVFYRDRRAIDVRPDNSSTAVERADVTVTALGASHVASRPIRAALVDYAGWGAWQFGDWYGQPHRAYSLAAQAGGRWPRARWKPWARAGASLASGDGNGRDDRHETFFPMLPEARSYAQSMVYTQANLRDLFVQVLVEPHRRARARGDLHRLDLVDAADRWYQGSGATARDGRFFGYSTRPSSGVRGLGTVLEGSVDVRISRFWSVNTYAGRMWGGPVVRGTFSSDRLFYWYVENLIRLNLRS